MRILLVGDGNATDHALVEQLGRSAEVLACLPVRNPAVSRLTSKCFIIDPENIEAIGVWALQSCADAAWVTSSPALLAGVSDVLEKAGIAVASPLQVAASLIGDREAVFRLMNNAGIAHPAITVCHTSKELLAALRRPVLLKAPRILPSETRAFSPAERSTALAYGKKLLRKYQRVIVQARVDGPAFLLHAFCDGTRISFFPPVQMLPAYGRPQSAYSTGALLPFLQPSDMVQAQKLFQQCVDTMRRQGRPVPGLLTAEFIRSKKGLFLLNFSPVPSPLPLVTVLPLLRTELAEIVHSIAERHLRLASFSDTSTAAKLLLPRLTKRGRKPIPIDLDETAVWNSGVRYYVHALDERKEKFFGRKPPAFILWAQSHRLEEADAHLNAAAAHFTGVSLASVNIPAVRTAMGETHER